MRKTHTSHGTKRILTILLMLILSLSLAPTAALAAGYGDTSGHWAEEVIDKWFDYGVVMGDDAGFRPNDPTFAMLSRMFSVPEDVTGLTGYADASSVSSWARAEVGGMVKAGYVKSLTIGGGVTVNAVSAEISSIVLSGDGAKLGVDANSTVENVRVDASNTKIEGSGKPSSPARAQWSTLRTLRSRLRRKQALSPTVTARR